VTTVSGTEGRTPRHIQFDDNSLLPLVFGAHDKHLVRIEQQLGVSLVARGNQVAIAGSPDATVSAEAVLRSLYNQVRDGELVNEGDVDAAVRMTRAGDGDGIGDRVLIQLHRKRIAARSAAQARYIQAMRQNDMIFGIGPAGTGKTYLAVCAAVEMFSRTPPRRR
jgi:phosphate starvation-inducible PhoH-like protein